MERLIKGTTAYKTFASDADCGKLSHAYMLHFDDEYDMRDVLKIFALKFFGAEKTDADARRILNENFTDCRIYPEPDKKLNADGVNGLIGDCALRPLERDKKLYIICGFNDLSALLQNKLLKTLEEPPSGVYFLLGATTLAPVLDTVKSRVKTLTVPPFNEEEILKALDRADKNPLNEQAALSCGGNFGEAIKMVKGGWFGEVCDAAREICSTYRLSEVGEVAAKHGDTKYKKELLMQMSLIYNTALRDVVSGKESGLKLIAPTLVYAAESVDKACEDLKFNAYFQGLLYDLMLRIIKENDKWLKLRA